MPKNNRYQENINKGLDKAYTKASVRTLELIDAQIIIFSDLHRGTGDDADDFRQSLMAYRAALDHYLDSGHLLIMLGDVEELWENSPAPVLEKYASLLQLEKEFFEKKRYWRFWGNHDDEWRNSSQVRKHLWKYFENLSVHEGTRLKFTEDQGTLGEILFVHGHQGTLDSDRFGWLSRYFVRYIWRSIQRIGKIRPNTPAEDWRLRHKHDVAMYNWSADKEQLLLFAGHTHHPVFPTQALTSRMIDNFESIQVSSTDQEQISEARADLEFARAIEKPSYFNSGCCCFSDGRITGIEIVSGQIRLVQWPDELGRAQPQILDSVDLHDIFDAAASRALPMDIILEMQ
jgi:hypothetical protein